MGQGTAPGHQHLLGGCQGIRGSRKTGKFYRLPTEGEWEYAARAGTTTKYAFGDTITKEQARFSDGRFGKSGDGKTDEVGSYPPNAWGLYDMHGNAWEYTEDCWQPSYRGAPLNGSARVTSVCPYRALRGGSWDYLPQDLRSAVRYKLKQYYRMDETGLRVVRSME
jgi:formylglycine-generating enzyme required for sulfatase activity